MTTANTANKQRGRPFKKGRSGNPSGKPKGARNKATMAVEALLDGQAEALTQTAILAALAGDMTALRLCLERIIPARKDSPVGFVLPKLSSAEDASIAVAAVAAVVKVVAVGGMTPGEGTAIAGLIETYRRVLETQEIETRLEQLEEQWANEKSR